MNTLNCDMQSYSGPDWSTSLFDMSNSVIEVYFLDKQRPKRRSIEIQVENEMTEQQNSR
jgi:hypothetical protein